MTVEGVNQHDIEKGKKERELRSSDKAGLRWVCHATSPEC
jgi:hypothetical protein